MAAHSSTTLLVEKQRFALCLWSHGFESEMWCLVHQSIFVWDLGWSSLELQTSCLRDVLGRELTALLREAEHIWGSVKCSPPTFNYLSTEKDISETKIHVLTTFSIERYQWNKLIQEYMPVNLSENKNLLFTQHDDSNINYKWKINIVKYELFKKMKGHYVCWQ